MIDLDLSLPVNKVRVLIGDIDSSFISDSNIEFVLTEVGGDVMLAAERSLKYILNYVATMVREETGDVEVYWNQLYEQLSKRYDSIEKENRYYKAKNLFYFGGTVKSDVRAVKNDPENTQFGVVDPYFYDAIKRLGISLDNPYILRG